MPSAWKSLTIGFLLGLLIEYLLCVAFAWLIGDKEPLNRALFYLAILFAVHFAIWVKNTLASTIYYWIWARGHSASAVSDQLSKLGFPGIEDSELVEEWLERTMRDSTLPAETQLNAAMTAGQLDFAKMQGLQAQLKFRGILKLAARRHTARMPALRSTTQHYWSSVGHQ